MTGVRYSFLDLVCFAMQRHSAAAQVQVAVGGGGDDDDDDDSHHDGYDDV